MFSLLAATDFSNHFASAIAFASVWNRHDSPFDRVGTAQAANRLRTPKPDGPASPGKSHAIHQTASLCCVCECEILLRKERVSQSVDMTPNASRLHGPRTTHSSVRAGAAHLSRWIVMCGS